MVRRVGFEPTKTLDFKSKRYANSLAAHHAYRGKIPGLC